MHRENVHYGDMAGIIGYREEDEIAELLEKPAEIGSPVAGNRQREDG